MPLQFTAKHPDIQALGGNHNVEYITIEYQNQKICGLDSNQSSVSLVLSVKLQSSTKVSESVTIVKNLSNSVDVSKNTSQSKD